MIKAKKYVVELSVLFSLLALLVFRHKLAFIIIMLVYAIVLTVELRSKYNYFIMIRYYDNDFKVNNIKWILEKSLNCSLLVVLISSVVNFFAGILLDYSSVIIWLLIFVFFFALGTMIDTYTCSLKKTLAILIIIWLLMFTISPLTIFVQVLVDINLWSDVIIITWSIILWMICALISSGLNYYLVRE